MFGNRSSRVAPAKYEEDPGDSCLSEKLKHDLEERVCRICMDSGTDALLSPCRCKGTMQFVHEECLKTWLVSQEGSIDEYKCELCKTELLMEFKVSSQCSPRDSCKEGLSQCLFIPLLVAVMTMLFTIVYLLAEQYLVGDSNQEEKGYTIALIITCSLSGLVIFLLIVNATREACCSAQLAHWHILNQHFEAEEEESQDISVAAVPKDPPDVSPTVIVIPKTIRMRGRKVRTPVLRPHLNPVVQRGRTVAYTPRVCTPQVCTPQVSVVKSVNFAMQTDPARPFQRFSLGASVSDCS